MNNQDPLTWVRLICMVAMLVMFVFYRRDSSSTVTSENDEHASASEKPKFHWGDWELKDEDCIVLHFRVEGSLIWWLTVEIPGTKLKEPTVMPKNFLPGAYGRIEMCYPGLLDGNEEEVLDFGIRYCTPEGTIETQFFKWALWRDPSPVPAELATTV